MKHEKHNHDHGNQDEGHAHHNHGHGDHGGDHAHHIKMFRNRFWISLIITVPILLLSEMIQQWFGFRITIPYQKWIVLFFSSVLYFYGGGPFIQGAIDEIKSRKPGMMTLIGTAISIAFFYSFATVFIIQGKDFFWELATLVDVMLLGHWIEAKSVAGASRVLEELVKIMPSEAHLLKDGDVEDVPIDQLSSGDLVLVRPGDKIPLDGKVMEGESSVNEALLTGESKPIHKEKDDRVIGGSINEDGVLRIKIEKTGEETYISQVIELVKKSQQSRSKTQNLANRAAALLFYVALSAGIITYIVWTLIGNISEALERSVTVLVIACPHALGLAIPLVVAFSTSISAKIGILIRNRTQFEQMRNIDAIVFDKTGTLTEGNFQVTDIHSYIDEKELIKKTYGVEINSEHIIANAISEYAKKKKIKAEDSKRFEVIPGKGTRAEIGKSYVHVGSKHLMNELDIDVDKPELEKIEKGGKSLVYTAIDNKLAGAFALSDKIREEAYEIVKKLQNIGIKVYMLTGDSEEVAKEVSKELGIDEYFAKVLPEKKENRIEQLKQKGYKVAMVGDGINDAPALLAADVGIAIGSGTDVAVESADVILVKNNLKDVERILNLSKKTYAKMIQNLWWAAGYNILALPLAAGVLAWAGIIIKPAFGAILMSLSTIIVAINAQTIKRGNIEEKNH